MPKNNITEKENGLSKGLISLIIILLVFLLLLVFIWLWYDLKMADLKKKEQQPQANALFKIVPKPINQLS